MTINTLIIPTRLPSLNDLINAMNHNRYSGAGIKRKAEREIESTITMTCDKLGHGYWLFEWHEYNKRRDPDNISSAHKYILDCLQTMEVIPNDNWAYVKEIHDRYVDDMTQETAYVKVLHCETWEEYISVILNNPNLTET